MAELVSDELWEQIESLLPPEPAGSPKRGRPRVSHRSALPRIIFILRAGTPWQALPSEMDFGSGSTCWRQFAERTQLGVWSKLHTLLQLTLGKAAAVNLERAVIDSASVRAVLGETTRGRTRRIVAMPGVNAMAPPLLL